MNMTPRIATIVDRSNNRLDSIGLEEFGVPPVGTAIVLRESWYRVVDHVRVQATQTAGGFATTVYRLHIVVAETSRETVFPTPTPESDTDETPDR